MLKPDYVAPVTSGYLACFCLSPDGDKGAPPFAKNLAVENIAQNLHSATYSSRDDGSLAPITFLSDRSGPVSSGLSEKVILNAHLLNQPELCLQPVNMFLFGFQDLIEDVAADEVLVGLTV